MKYMYWQWKDCFKIIHIQIFNSDLFSETLLISDNENVNEFTVYPKNR